MTVATRGGRLVVLDPTAKPVPRAARMAPPVDRLEGKRVGLLTNGKPNGMRLLEEVLKVLCTGVEPAAVLYRQKESISKPAAALLDELATSCDFVLNAIGD